MSSMAKGMRTVSRPAGRPLGVAVQMKAPNVVEVLGAGVPADDVHHGAHPGCRVAVAGHRLAWQGRAGTT